MDGHRRLTRDLTSAMRNVRHVHVDGARRVAGAPLVVRGGDELKLVFPQAGAPPEAFESLAFTRFSLQPMEDGARTDANTQAAVAYCLAHPRWRLSLQTHKLLGLR